VQSNSFNSVVFLHIEREKVMSNIKSDRIQKVKTVVAVTVVFNF
jgi:hypothetical protein